VEQIGEGVERSREEVGSGKRGGGTEDVSGEGNGRGERGQGDDGSAIRRGKGKGVVREAVGLPEVTSRGLAWRRIKSAGFVVDSNEEDKEVPAANPVLRAMLAVSPLKGQKVEVMLPALQVTAG
jgi:hypothetical protein